VTASDAQAGGVGDVTRPGRAARRPRSQSSTPVSSGDAGEGGVRRGRAERHEPRVRAGRVRATSRPPSWWRGSVGGAPYWLLALVGLLLAGCATLVILSTAGVVRPFL
jgi:hypothetical protein